MANKSVYQDFDADALQHFGLVSASLKGVLTASGVEKVLVTQDKTTYENIKRLLSVPNESDTTFINKKKAFILPKCDVSQDRLKGALREHKITVTNDYELCDLVIGHENISRRVENADHIPSTVMMCRFWNMETIANTNGHIKSVDDSVEDVIFTEKISSVVRYYDLDVVETLHDEWMLTGMAINLAYKIDIGEIGVIDPETVLHSSASKTELDESLIEMIKSQFDSYSDDDISLAAKILPTIDYNKNIHLLWHLCNEIEHKVYKLNRNKDVQYWLEQSNFHTLCRNNAEDMIKYLEEEGKLDKITFRYFEPICRKEISIHNRELYVFKVNVKKEYLKYL